MFRVRQNPAPSPARAAPIAPNNNNNVAAAEVAQAEAVQDVLEVAAVLGHFEAHIEPKSDLHRVFLERCASFDSNKVNVDLNPDFWEKLNGAGTKVVEQAFLDALAVAGVHSSAAASSLDLLNESGTLGNQDANKIAKQQIDARKQLDDYKEGGKCFNVGGTPRKVKKAYAKAFDGCDMEKDHSADKASQRFRESLLKIAAMPLEKRQVELQFIIESQPRFSAAAVIALFRLNRSFS